MQKKALWTSLALVVALSAGWLTGASGRTGVELDLRRANERADFATARALVLAGQVSLARAQFTDAADHFTSAASLVDDMQRRLRETSEADRAGQLQIALVQLREAREGADARDPDAWSAAEAALLTLMAVAGPR